MVLHLAEQQIPKPIHHMMASASSLPSGSRRVLSPGQSCSLVILMVLLLLAWSCAAACATDSPDRSPGASESASAEDASAVRGVVFEAVTDSIWHVPVVGETTRVTLALQITNRHHEPVCFSMFDTISIVIIASDGETLRMGGGRNRTGPGMAAVSRPVAPGGSLLVSRAGDLIHRRQGGLRLIGSDGLRGVWYVDRLMFGTYQVQVVYESGRQDTIDGTPVWTGRAVTQPKEVTLR